MIELKDLIPIFVKCLADHHYFVTEAVLDEIQPTVSFYTEYSSPIVKVCSKICVSTDKTLVFDFIFNYENNLVLPILSSLAAINRINDKLTFIKYYIDSESNQLFANYCFIYHFDAGMQQQGWQEIIEQIDSCVYEMTDNYNRIDMLGIKSVSAQSSSVLMRQVELFVDAVRLNDKTGE